MNVWYHLSTIFNQRRVLRIVGILTLCVAFITMLFFGVIANAAPGVNKTISFQGRLLTSAGTPVPDGFYNIQFKIYQDGTGTAVGNPDGSLEWTETYINNGGNNGVKVTNGYMSVNLGTNVPFGTSVDWNQDTLWLSMNIAGLTTGCTTFDEGLCEADGEMTPMKRLTSTPYALNAGMLGGISADGFIKNDGTSQAGSYDISGTGRANVLQGTTSVLAPLFDSSVSSALNIGTVNATDINIGTSLYAQDINIGNTDDGIKNVTLGSKTSISSTLIQGGGLGIRLESSGGVALHANGSGIDALIVEDTGRIRFNLTSTENLLVANTSGNALLEVINDTGTIRTGANSLLQIDGNATFYKGISIQGTTTYQTPGGYSMNTAIGIPNYAVPNYSSVFAFGLPASSSASARGILVADARTGNHQATIGVLSPDENQIMGFSWNGSTTTGYITNTANSLALQGGGVNILTATNNGGAAQVGIGNDGSAGHSLDVTGDINASTNFSLGGISILDSSSLKFNDASISTIEAADSQALQLVADGGVKIGDSTASGDPTLLTLDKATTAPTATGDAILGSMYYDTTLGKVQCYEADGWGSCSSSPDTYVSLDPEYANSVMNGTGVGTLTAEFCSDALNINDGSSSQPQFCNTNETYNLYNWTSASATAQTKNIFVTQELPANFKRFAPGTTSLTSARSTDATSEYQVYKSNSSGLVACGSPTTLGTTGSWQKLVATGTADPANCSFEAGDKIVFKITLTAHSGAGVAASTINFAYNND